MHQEQVHELLYQALETELGGMKVYQTALQCTVNAELKHEWQEYLEQTEKHAQILRELFDTLKLNPDQETPGRQVGAAGGRRVRRHRRNERSFELGTHQRSR
jgi:rubrerythrin